MLVGSPFPCDHKDLVHDVAFNWYGTHMATCSSDQSVKVWTWKKEERATKARPDDQRKDQHPTDPGFQPSWECVASWKAHSGAVWKVTWAHPEFGQVLATCSFDRTAAIWEEMPGEPTPGLIQAGDSSAGVVSSTTGQQSHWVKKFSMVDSRTSVTDVKFAPRHMGLRLATCSADGIVRVYEAPDVMNLSQWTLLHEIPCKLTCSCISWNHCLNRKQAPLLAVGSDDSSPSNGAKVFLFQFSALQHRWVRIEALQSVTDPVNDVAFAPNVGRSYHVLAVATKDLKIVTIKQEKDHNEEKFDVRLAGQFNDHLSTVWRVCWNVTGTILASSGDDGKVKMWKANYKDNWKCVATIRGEDGGEATTLSPGHSDSLNGSSSVNAHPATMAHVWHRLE